MQQSLANTGVGHPSMGAVSAEQRRQEERLVRANLPLVNYAVNEVCGRVPRHVTRADLESAALEGLAHAARGFDPGRGIGFDRYASIRIRGALLDELRRRSWLSRSVHARSRKLNAVTDDLTTRLGRSPTKAEVAQAAEMEEGAVEAVADDAYLAVILNLDPVAGKDHVAPDVHAPDAVLMKREREAYLRNAIDVLPDRLRRVVIGYFFEERPTPELASELGVTESRVWQMRAQAIELLREGLNSQLDPDALAVDDAPGSVVARRKAAYYAAIARASDFRTRLTARPASSTRSGPAPTPPGRSQALA